MVEEETEVRVMFILGGPSVICMSTQNIRDVFILLQFFAVYFWAFGMGGT